MDFKLEHIPANSQSIEERARSISSSWMSSNADGIFVRMSQRSVGLAARAWALIDNWATVAAVEYESLDFDSMATPLAAPAGFVLHGVSVLFKLQEQEYITWNQDGAANDYPYMLWAAVMLLISTLNFLLVFGSSKEYVCAKADMYRYTLFHHPTESDSRNIYSSSVVPSPNARLVEIESSQGTLVRWQISTWNPPAFGMALFTVYSPMTAFCYILGRGNNGILLGAASWLMVCPLEYLQYTADSLSSKHIHHIRSRA